MRGACRPLIEVLAEIPDPRSRQGRRHPLSAVLALSCTAMLCGYQSYGAIAEWTRNYGRPWAQALGLTHRTPPCAATLHAVFRALDRTQVEAVLGAWAEAILCATPAGGRAPEAVAVDGKTLRGSRQQGVPGAHLLSAVSQRLGLTLGQTAVGDKTNEIPLVQTLLAGLVLDGRIFTMDALLTQRAIAATIVAGRGDYVMTVKGNQPRLREDIQTVFEAPPSSSPPPAPPPRRSTTATDGSNGAS
jgi:DDE_Tnp_1-associated/Transposase DDE domain